MGHPGAQHPRTNEQSTGLFITSLSLGRPFKSCMYEAVKLRYPEYTRQLDDVVIDDARN